MSGVYTLSSFCAGAEIAAKDAPKSVQMTTIAGMSDATAYANRDIARREAGFLSMTRRRQRHWTLCPASEDDTSHS